MILVSKDVPDRGAPVMKIKGLAKMFVVNGRFPDFRKRNARSGDLGLQKLIAVQQTADIHRFFVFQDLENQGILNLH